VVAARIDSRARSRVLCDPPCNDRSNSAALISMSRRMLRSVPIFKLRLPCTGTVVCAAALKAAGSP